MNERSRIKTAITQIIRKMINSADTQPITTEGIITALRQGHQPLIKDLTDQLVNQQLTRYVSSVVGEARQVDREATLLDLISDEESLPVMYTLQSGEKKRLEDLMADQIRELAAREQKARQAAQRASPIQMALAEIEKANVTGEMTLGQLIRSGV